MSQHDGADFTPTFNAIKPLYSLFTNPFAWLFFRVICFMPFEVEIIDRVLGPLLDLLC